MAIKNLIARGVGFSPGSVKFIPTLGFGIGAVAAIPSKGAARVVVPSSSPARVSVDARIGRAVHSEHILKSVG